MTDLSFVIVNYKTPQLIYDCLSSIVEQLDDISYEVIVVDNGSEDNTLEMAQKALPEVVWIDMICNAGYTKAKNAGFRKASGKYILSLDSDTLVIKEGIKACIDYFEDRPNEKLGIVSCRLNNPDGSLQFRTFWGINTLRKTIFENAIYIFLNRIFKRKNKGKIHLENQHQGIFEPKWISGAFLMLSNQFVKEQNVYWDEDFFLYCEDVEFCTRIRKNGYKLVYLPEAGAFHLDGGSQSVKIPRIRRIILAEFLCFMKTRGKFLFLISQSLRLFNIYVDDLMLFKSNLLGETRFFELKAKLLRNVQKDLIYQYTGKILFDYSTRSSSGKVPLQL